MNSDSYNLDGSHKFAGYQKPRWRSVFIALLLALVLGSGIQTPPARAASDSATKLSFFMLAVKEGASKPVCIGERVHLNVLVYRQKTIDGVSAAPEPVTGLSVMSVVDNPIIGKISPDENTTLWASATYPGAADFVFQAESPGTTIVAFSAIIKTPGWFGTDFGGGDLQLVSAQVDVRVVPCKFKVNSVSIFRAGMTSVGIMDAEMESDENGSFTGTATVNWVTSMLCGISSPIEPGKADLTGTLNESGQLVGEIIFGPMTSTGGGPCGMVSVTTSNFGTLDPLTIKASYDGVSVYTQAQGINVTNGSFTGTASIVVIPEEQGAVAFNADSRAAPSPPAWWALLWDEFPGLFGALLVLR